ncbi:MAG: ABC transporter ATP-binding protein [Anaerolineales bacterium]
MEQGEVVGIIGRNGAGKSTLLKILSRITKPTIGQVRLRGRVGSLLEVGTGFHPELTGRENVYLNGAILGMTRAEIDKKFDEIVDFAEIDKFIDTPVKHYSSGMGLRLGFAVAAHLEPEILVVDEVLAVGDAAFQKKCLGKMGDVASEGRTVLFVSHNMVAVQNLCDRVLLIDIGRVMDDGKSEVVISKYLQNAAQNIEIPLLDRKDRKGSGAIQFSSVTFHNERGEQLNSLQSGENVVIRIGFENKSKINIRKLHITFNIDNSKGQRITTLSTYAKNEIFESIDPNSKFIEIHIERLPLMAGRYEFTLFSRIHGING